MEKVKFDEEKKRIDLLNRQFENVTQENRDLKNMIDKKNKQLDELVDKKIYYEEDLNIKDQEKYRLQLEIDSLEKELQENKNLIHQYEIKIEEVKINYF